MNAQTPYKLRILLYGPTTDFAGANYEVNFINNHPAEFQPIGTGGTDSQIWTEQQWINASKASFAAFDAIVFSDKGENGEKWAAALNSRAVWGGAVNGNIFVVGGDPVSDFLEPSGNQGPSDRVFRQGVRFAAAQPGNAHTRTGLYVALDHSPAGEPLDGVVSPTDVPLLSWFGSFKAVMSEGAGLRRAVTDHPKLNSLGPDFPPWTTSVAQGFHSWPSEFYPVAYSFDATAPTPTSVFAPALEHDTGYKHPNHLNRLVFALAKTVGNFEEKFLTASTPNQGLATSGIASLSVFAYYRDDPSGANYWPTTPISWRVISGPNVGKNGGCSQNGQSPPYSSSWTASYACTAANVTAANFQDVVRIFYDYDNDKVFDDFAGNNNGSGDPTAACDFGITLTVNWGLPRVSIATTDASATEASGNNATFRISRAGGTSTQDPLPVKIISPENSSAAIGQAKAGTDYVLKVGGLTVSDLVTIPVNSSFVDITILPVQDNVPEGTETLRLSLADPVDSSYVVAGNGFATAAITDDDQPAVTVSSAVIDGGNLTASENGAILGLWVVDRGVVTSTALHVFLNVSGNATRAVDYTVEEGENVAFTPSGTVLDVTIPAFETMTLVSLTAFEDSRTEGTEYATLTLKSHPNYRLGSPNTAAINITETDSVKIPVNGYTITQTGPSSFDAYAVNDAIPPAVVGSFFSPSGATHAYRYIGGTVTDLGAIQKTTQAGAAHHTFGYGINPPPPARRRSWAVGSV